MVVGAYGDPGAIAPEPVAEEFSIPFAPVTTLYQKMEGNSVRAREFSIAPAIRRPAQTPMVRHSVTDLEKINLQFSN